ncbi:MAG: NAD-dependent epimerase/dehydratase family protein [Phycisphaerae bacterium]|nr:NAD-dependent epimerase/dehydratase family protein [Phycisphaerae bacterium]
MRILITGGAGFIGSHTADALLARGHEVRVLDSLEEPVHPGRRVPDYLDRRVEFMRGDVRDEATLLRALQDQDAVYHLAAFQDYLPQFSRFVDVNVASTARIYELALREKLPLRRVIVASSQATLGEGLYLDADGRRCLPDMRPDAQLRRGVFECQAPEGFRGPLRWQPTDEGVANPQNPYGMSKIAEEQFALRLGERYGIPTVAMRYSIVQGPRQSFHNAYSGACRVFSLAAHQRIAPPIYEDGMQIRDFVNVHDVVDANLLVLEDPRSDYEMFNVGGDRAMTVLDFAGVVAEVFGTTDLPRRPSGKYRFGDTRHICSDVSKLKALGWRPRRGVLDSVGEYRRWLDTAEDPGRILEECQKLMERLQVVRPVEVGS